jgi:apolipoprotein N-acyltransferase
VAQTLLWVIIASAAFHVAYFSSATSWFITLYLFALVQLSRTGSPRRAFYAGLVVGLIISAGRLNFFWGIFSIAAPALWLVYAFWIGLFTLLARLCLLQLSYKWALASLPVIWCGLEYFRSELYYLRFSWLSAGFAFGANPALVPLHQVGVYGIGLFLMALACLADYAWRKSRLAAVSVLVAGSLVVRFLGWVAEKPLTGSPAILQVAGVQLEFPTEKQVCAWLDQLIRREPNAQLLVLSEYTFSTPIPASVRNWCQEHRRYLIVGGKDPVADRAFYDTAFVISPDGRVIFRQAKAVPIQFFDDGVPAPQQQLWHSPWGNLGICICYDLSYSRVTDQLIRQGAQALIVPTMDVEDWGLRQPQLHARVAPVRAAEYGVPIFRVASSGISQAVDSNGRVMSAAPCPGQGAIIAADLPLRQHGQLPADRWMGFGAAVVTAIMAVALLVPRVLARRPHDRGFGPV